MPAGVGLELLAQAVTGEPACAQCRPPCVDYVAVGLLNSSGKSVGGGIFANGDEVVMAHSMQLFEFSQRRRIVGRSRSGRMSLRRGAYETFKLPPTPAVAAVVFKGHRRPYFAGWAPIWTDRDGRQFVPVRGWPVEDGSRWLDWRPHDFRAFARPVRYDAPQPIDSFYRPPKESNEFFEVTPSGYRVRMGVFLDDFPAMFAAGKGKPCQS